LTTSHAADTAKNDVLLFKTSVCCYNDVASRGALYQGRTHGAGLHNRPSAQTALLVQNHNQTNSKRFKYKQLLTK